ncbi:hypothetical protein chiPu_0033609, partial [Chiloscyllium punctatum]|nr:hypothetical protein [Chiloscyllium punctatum]
AIRIRELIGARPARIEQFFFAKRAVVGIDDRAGAPFDFATERDLNVIGHTRPGRRRHERARPPPLRDLQTGLLQPLPDRRHIAVFPGEFGRHPWPQFAKPRAVGTKHRSGIAPVIVIDRRDAERKARKRRGEGRDQVRIGRGRIERGEDGFERRGIGEAGRGGHRSAPSVVSR